MKPDMTQRINKLADSSILASGARLVVTFGTPLLTGLMIWIGTTTAANNTAINVLSEKVTANAAAQTSTSANIQTQYDKFESWAMRTFGDHEARLRTVEQRR